MDDPEQRPITRELALCPLYEEDLDILLGAMRPLPKDAYRVVTTELGGYRVGDPGALAVIITISDAAIGALAIFLAKSRRRATLDYTLEITEADGATRRESLHLETSASDAPTAALVARLTSLTQPPD